MCNHNLCLNNEAVLMCNHNLCLNKNKKNNKTFQLKIIIFAAEKIHNLLYKRVNLMQLFLKRKNKTHRAASLVPPSWYIVPY